MARIPLPGRGRLYLRIAQERWECEPWKASIISTLTVTHKQDRLIKGIVYEVLDFSSSKRPCDAKMVGDGSLRMRDRMVEIDE